jgi:hypothetical protein
MSKLILPGHFQPYEASILFINNNWKEGSPYRLFETLFSCFLFASGYYNPKRFDQLSDQPHQDKPEPIEKSPVDVISYSSLMEEKQFLNQKIAENARKIIDLCDQLKNHSRDGVHSANINQELLSCKNKVEEYKRMVVEHNQKSKELSDYCNQHMNGIRKSVASIEKTSQSIDNTLADLLETIIVPPCGTKKGHFMCFGDVYELYDSKVYKNKELMTETDMIAILENIPLSYLETYLLGEFPLESLTFNNEECRSIKLRFANREVKVEKHYLSRYSPTYASLDISLMQIPFYCSDNVLNFFLKILREGFVHKMELDIDDLNDLVNILTYLDIKIGDQWEHETSI